MRYHIRTALLDDIPAISKISKAAFSTQLTADYAPDVLQRALPFICEVSRPLVQSGGLFVATDDGQGVVGAGGWSREYHGVSAIAGLGHMRHFVVHPDFVRQGIGKVLFERCLEAAPDIEEFEAQASLSAVAFYIALGFEVISDDAVTLPDGTPFATCLMKYKRHNKTPSET